MVFGTPENYRVESLCFEVILFSGGYHALLGRPTFAKFMAIPCDAYLKLKMSGPNGVITVSIGFGRSHEAEQAHMAIAE